MLAVWVFYKISKQTSTTEGPTPSKIYLYLVWLEIVTFLVTINSTIKSTGKMFNHENYRLVFGWKKILTTKSTGKFKNKNDGRC